MNRIVRENYPVSKLPADLRDGLPADAAVRVTVETPLVRQGPRFADLIAELPDGTVTVKEAVRRVRRIRDGGSL
jgi:hypothetical protein